jgi:HSP20 family protein
MNTLTRWEPFRSYPILQDRVDRLFEDTFLAGDKDSALTAWAPAVDVHETENELVVTADLPGISERDLDVRVENNMLTIRGERKQEKNVTEGDYLRVERAYGSFTRSFTLPNTVNTGAIKADYHDGVLTVKMPKREEAKPKQVKINISTNGQKA